MTHTEIHTKIDERYYTGMYSILYEFCKGKKLKETAFIFKNKGFRDATIVCYQMDGDRIEMAENGLKLELWNMVKDFDLTREEKADVCRCLYYVKKFVL